jgi:hypothetical protein
VLEEQVMVSWRVTGSHSGVSSGSIINLYVCVPGAVHVEIGMPPSSSGVAGLSAVKPRATYLSVTGPQSSDGGSVEPR